MMGLIYHLNLPAEGSVDHHCPETCTQEKRSKYLLDKKNGKKVSNKHKWKRWIINTKTTSVERMRLPVCSASHRILKHEKSEHYLSTYFESQLTSKIVLAQCWPIGDQNGWNRWKTHPVPVLRRPELLKALMFWTKLSQTQFRIWCRLNRQWFKYQIQMHP